MTQGRTRKIQDKFVKAREFTRALARYNTEEKTGSVYRKVQAWQGLQIAELKTSGSAENPDMYSIPAREHFYSWWKQDIQIARELNFQEWTKTYSPIEMHNNPFWSTPYSPYPLTDSSKEIMSNAYNDIARYWFMPLGFKKPIMTVAQAVWIAILVNAQPKLKYNPIDSFLLAEYFSTVHLNFMHDVNSPTTPISNPTQSVDTNALFYLESSPWHSKFDFERYDDMTKEGRSLYLPPPYIFNLQQTFLKPEESIDNNIAWQLQYPMLYGSQLPNMAWNPPYLKAVRFLSAICLEFLEHFRIKGMVKDRTIFNSMHKKCNHILATVMARSPKSMVPKKIGTDQVAEGNDQFDLIMIDRFYRLLLNLWQLQENDDHIAKETHEVLVTPIAKDYLNHDLFPVELDHS